MVKRPIAHVLEKESGLALEALLPSEWILRDMKPDYGLDKELTIVEGEDVTNKVVWLQLKATEKLTPNQKSISHDFETKHLKYWEICRLPVIVLYWIKAKNEFYYLFAQRYIKEMLSPDKPEWRNQKTVSVAFPLESKLVGTKSLTAIATEGHLYVVQQQLTQKTGSGPHYWLDGIPKSDDRKLKEYTLRALLYSSQENHPGAIKQLEKALKECTIGPAEKMSLLLNLGNEYYRLSQNKEALKNYQAMLELAGRVTEKEALEGKSAALSGIGLIHSEKGDPDRALKYHKDALKIHREIGYKQGQACDLGNMGLIYSDKGDLDRALKYARDSLNIARDIGYKQGEANSLCNIGVIFSDKGDLNQALKYYKDALKIDREIGYKRGEASDLGNVALVHKAKGDLDQALKHLKRVLKIHREIRYKRDEASDLTNMGLIHATKGDFDLALKHHKDALKIEREIGYKQGEANVLGNIGLIYSDKGDLDQALKYYEDALKIHRAIGYKQGEASGLGNIGVIHRAKGDLDQALKYLEDAVKIHIEIGHKQGQAADLNNVGAVYKDMGNLDKAVQYCNDALKIFEEMGMRVQVAIAKRNIDKVSQQIKQK